METRDADRPSMRGPRPPARTPSPPELSNCLVFIRHPGYNQGADVLLSLPAFDRVDLPDGTHASGVHYRTVCTACAIISGNRADHWISRSRRGTVDFAAYRDDAVLPPGDYYLHVPPPAGEPAAPDTYRYPVVPNFRSWRFPASLPESFAAVRDTTYVPSPLVSLAGAADNVRLRDGSCRLTASSLGLERAHFIPAGEKEWFGQQQMALYAPGGLALLARDAVDSEPNGFVLREDLHTLYDKRLFSIVPKRSRGSWVLVAHVSTLGVPELVKSVHNLQLKPIRGCVPEYLYARFAWDIFPQLMAFLQQGVPRTLCVRAADGSTQTAEFDGDECANLCERQGHGRSASPKKRKQRDGSAAMQETESLRSLDSAVSGLHDHVPARDEKGLEKLWAQVDAEQDMRRKRREREEEGSSTSPSPPRGRRRYR